MRSLLTCIEINGIVHNQAPGEGTITRCGLVFVTETPSRWPGWHTGCGLVFVTETPSRWPGWHTGRLLEQGTPVDCMTCLVRAAR